MYRHNTTIYLNYLYDLTLFLCILLVLQNAFDSRLGT